MTSPVGLYVHLPFCDAKCSYCDFVTFTDRHAQIDSYLAALAAEMARYRGWPLQTLFVGGGTPTVLSPNQIEKLMRSIHQTFGMAGMTEATVEANPESATRDRLKAYQHAGINRLSFGVQTTNNLLLEKLGRLHNRETFLDRFESARSLGFQNINIDLMFGLPGQTLKDWHETLESVVKLHPEHISTYALKVEPSTKLGRDGFVVNGDLEADMYLFAADFLVAHGYGHYEISNFAKPGRESQHNLLYWQNKNTVGIGISSTSYVDGRRFKNTPHLKTYLDKARVSEQSLVEDVVLEANERQKESAMLALRLKRGIAHETLNGLDVPMTQTFLERGLAVLEKGMYSLTPKGWLLSNLLFEQFV